jgi:hypothetical protein
MEKVQNPFAPLHLGLQDQQELETLAAGLVEECVAQFAQHLEGTKAQGRLDPLRWKHVKSREDVHVYQERQGFVSAEDTNESGLPMLQGVGTIVGDLDDVMYGVVNSSLDSMRIKTTYVNDKIVNAAVLANLIDPSVNDPFRCLAVKWSSGQASASDTSSCTRCSSRMSAQLLAAKRCAPTSPCVACIARRHTTSFSSSCAGFSTPQAASCALS